MNISENIAVCHLYSLGFVSLSKLMVIFVIKTKQRTSRSGSRSNRSDQGLIVNIRVEGSTNDNLMSEILSVLYSWACRDNFAKELLSETTASPRYHKYNAISAYQLRPLDELS